MANEYIIIGCELDQPFKFSRAENSSIICRLHLPEPVFSDDDDMARVTRVARLRMRDAPIQALRTRYAATIKHPPRHE